MTQHGRLVCMCMEPAAVSLQFYLHGTMVVRRSMGSPACHALGGDFLNNDPLNGAYYFDEYLMDGATDTKVHQVYEYHGPLMRPRD